jgi:hypothetical protein
MRKAYADARFTFEEVNGVPTLLTWSGDVLTTVMVCHIAGGQIQAPYTMLNPDKLGVHRAVTPAMPPRLLCEPSIGSH